MKKNHIKYGIIILCIYFLLIILSKIFNIFNIDYLPLDFLVDSYKKTKKTNYTYPKQVFIVEITDHDIIKYNLDGYYLPRKPLIDFLELCEARRVNSIFFDLNIYFSTSEGNTHLTESDRKLIDTFNTTNTKIFLLENNDSIIYKQLNTNNIEYVDVNVKADFDYTIREIATKESDNYIAYKLYEEISSKKASAILDNYSSKWLDSDFSSIIIFKEFLDENSYYSGLSKLSLDDFIQSKINFKNSIILFGRVDTHNNDSFNTAIGVLPGLYIHANALMSMIHFGAIKSYYILNAAIAFLFGLFFALYKDFLDSLEENFNELQYELLLIIFVTVGVLTLVGLSYVLFGYYTIWIDLITIILSLTLMEFFEILYGNIVTPFIKKINNKAAN